MLSLRGVSSSLPPAILQSSTLLSQRWCYVSIACNRGTLRWSRTYRACHKVAHSVVQRSKLTFFLLATLPTSDFREVSRIKTKEDKNGAMGERGIRRVLSVADYKSNASTSWCMLNRATTRHTKFRCSGRKEACQQYYYVLDRFLPTLSHTATQTASNMHHVLSCYVKKPISNFFIATSLQ
jgi:hypothetical protein